VGKQKVTDQTGVEVLMPRSMVSYLNVGNIPAKEIIRPNVAGTFLPLNNIDCDIDITARNGAWLQGLRTQKIDGTWAFATRITERSTGNVVFESVPENYPHGEGGEINWTHK
jgi:hypothetical protein